MLEYIKITNTMYVDVTEKDVPEEIYASAYLYTYGQDKNGASLGNVIPVSCSGMNFVYHACATIEIVCYYIGCMSFVLSNFVNSIKYRYCR